MKTIIFLHNVFIHKKGIIWRVAILLNLLILNNYVLSQQDAVRNLINNAPKSEEVTLCADNVDLFNKLAWEYVYTDPEKAYNYGKQAYIWSVELGYNKGTAFSLINIAYIFILTQSDFDKAMNCFKKAYRISGTFKNDKEEKNVLAEIYQGLALINFKLHEFEAAIENYKEALILYRLVGQHYNLSVCYHNLGYIYKKIGDHKSSLYYYRKEIVNNERIRKNNLCFGKSNLDENIQLVKIEKIEN